MSTGAMPAPCRVFEEALLERGAPWSPAPPDPHAGSCPRCADLLEALAESESLFRSLRPPAVPDLLVRNLVALPSDFARRRRAAAVLDLLEPGVLGAPVPSPELLERLARIPSTRRALPAPPVRPHAERSVLSRMLTDWRFPVVVAYAAAILIVAILRVDPLSAAREAASDVTAAGERALTEARQAAARRLAEAPLVRAARPLTERLDYRLYRALVAGRARAVAYSQLAFERLFGGSVAAADSSKKPPRPDRPPDRTELGGPHFRS